MGRTLEIIDPDEERRRSVQRKILVLACVVSLGLFGYPEVKDYFSKWQALQAGRKLSYFLIQLRTQALLSKTPLEARFASPDLIEVDQVSSCGPFAQRKKISETHLSDFEPGVEFAPESWVRGSIGTHEAVIPRYCYDPIYGSSIIADGLAHGGIFLAHHTDIAAGRGDHAVEVLVEGGAGDISLE